MAAEIPVAEIHAGFSSPGANPVAELDQVANTYELKYGAHFTAPEGTWSWI